jgi:hypothetical protein
MIYICGWVFNYFLMLLGDLTQKRRLAAAVSVVALGAVVILRGRVGADTGFVYESMAANISNGLNTEPLFVGFLFVAVLLFPTPLLAVTMGIGSLFVLSLFIYVCRADDRELFILHAYYIPAAFWGSSISGERYGLAFTFLLLGMQSIRLRQYKWAVALSTAAILTHYSCVLFIVLWGALVIKANRRNYLLLTTAVVLLSGILATLANVHFQEKYIVYLESGYTKPSGLSGLASILTTGMLLLAVVLGSLSQTEKFKFVGITLLGVMASFAISMYSYGGLRLLGMVGSTVPYAALCLYQRNRLPLKVNFMSMILLVGFVSTLLTFKDMLNEDQVLTIPGRSLPYTFFWQE